MNMTSNEPSNQDLSFLTILATIFLCTLFGSNAVAIKMAFQGLGVFTTAGVRFSIAAIVIFLWARSTGKPLGLKKGQLHQILILSLIFWAQLSLFYFGISKSNASRGTLLANLVPFFILFLAHLFIPGDRITRKKFFGILLGFGGIVFMFADNGDIAADFRTGDLIILAGTFLWSCNAVYLKKIISGYNAFQIVLYNTVIAAPLFFLEALLFDSTMISHLDGRVLGAVLYQSLVTASFGFVTWNTMLQKYGAVALHSFVFIMPIAGVALGGLLLDEPITPKIIVALVLITSGILVVHWKAKKEAPAYPIRRGL
jgi:drug/metabolite transporter (DMT)-like permease